MRYMEKTATFKALIGHDTDNIDIGDISRYFRFTDPSLIRKKLRYNVRGLCRVLQYSLDLATLLECPADLLM